MAVALLEVGRSNVVRFCRRTLRGASSGRSESCLEVSECEWSAIGLSSHALSVN